MNKQKSPVSIYDEFTHKYKLSKTLRFELKPVGETLHWLGEHGVVEKDKDVDVKYQELKPLMDREHQDFIKRSLVPDKVADIDFSSYGKALLKGKEGKKETETEAKKLYKAILTKMDGFKDICGKAVLDLVAQRGKEEKDIADIFRGNKEKKLPGFSTYLTNFQKNRENLYKADGTATAVPTRVVENFATYQMNQNRSESKQHEVTFDVGPYTNYFTQDYIEKYNKKVGEFNKEVKALRDQDKEHKGEYRLLKTLKNQILAEKETEVDDFEISEDNLKTRYQEFMGLAQLFYSDAHNLLNTFVCGSTGDPLQKNDIYLTNRAINTLSRRWFIDGYGLEMDLTNKTKGGKKPEQPKVRPFVSLAEVADFCGDKTVGEVFKESFIEKESLDINDLARKVFANQFQAELKKESVMLETKLEGRVSVDEEFSRTKDEDIHALKTRLDAGLHLVQLMKYFVVDGGKKAEAPDDKNVEFYNELDRLVGDLRAKHEIVKRYDAFRHFFTKKLDAKDKIKLNFESGTPIKWTTRGYLFRNADSGDYYAGVLVKGVGTEKQFDPENSKLFGVYKTSSALQQLEYKQLKFQTLAGRGYIRDFGVKYSEDPKAVEHLQELIRRQYLSKYPTLAPLVEEGFDDKKSFDKRVGEIMSNCYELSMVPVEESYLFGKVKEGAIYLFEISNKDKRAKCNAKKNLHTYYFESLFEEGSNLKLNSQGTEIFFRDKQVKEKVIEKRGRKEVLKQRRYTEDKILLHLPIILNKDSVDALYPAVFNRRINDNTASITC